MCGICGIINPNGLKVDSSEVVHEMNKAIFHRGPDEDGYYSDSNCHIAMRRLSIIDVVGGQQPMYNEDRSIVVFMNGEIYNYADLKIDLIKKGHSFYSQSDTEVIAHLYEEYAERFVEKLNGMFVCCLYDIRNDTWILGRDRFGEKPLYYYFKEGYLSFSSEINSLLKDKTVPRNLNKELLPLYLSNTIIPEPHTLFKDVLTLPAGFILILKKSELDLKSYYSINYKANKALKTVEDCKSFLEPILKKAVKNQLISDVPIGAFLSGGVDSSTVVSFMQELSDKPIKTFTVKFENDGYDESIIAKEVADALGTEHNQITVANQTFTKDIFWKIIDHIGLPFPDSSAIPTYFITKEIRKHVKVALSGDGGDELFAGYPFYQWWSKVLKIKNLVGPTVNLTNSILGHIPFIGSNSTVRQINRALLASKGTDLEIGSRMSILFDEKEISNLLKIGRVPFELLASFPKESKNWTTLRKAMYYRLKHDLPLDMLTKVDRMSMSNSLEVRAPFLDVELFEASCQIPDEFLISKGSGKKIIKEIMRNKLPDSVFNHPKTGFSIPLHQYMNNDFDELVEELIFTNKKMEYLFNLKDLRKIVFRGLHQKTDKKVTVYRASHQLWSLLQLGGWLKRYNVEVN